MFTFLFGTNPPDIGCLLYAILLSRALGFIKHITRLWWIFDGRLCVYFKQWRGSFEGMNIKSHTHTQTHPHILLFVFRLSNCTQTAGCRIETTQHVFFSPECNSCALDEGYSPYAGEPVSSASHFPTLLEIPVPAIFSKRSLHKTRQDWTLFFFLYLSLSKHSALSLRCWCLFWRFDAGRGLYGQFIFADIGLKVSGEDEISHGTSKIIGLFAVFFGVLKYRRKWLIGDRYQFDGKITMTTASYFELIAQRQKVGNVS